jgi:hypothetical protein
MIRRARPGARVVARIVAQPEALLEELLVELSARQLEVPKREQKRLTALRPEQEQQEPLPPIAKGTIQPDRA